MCLTRLPKSDGSYLSTPNIKQAYDLWPNTKNTALADTAGWSNTEALIAAQGSDYLGGATTTFRNGSSNQGYKDWFVPACGQLAYMYLNVTEINDLLAKCSNPAGTTLPTTSSDYHWSSSEYNTYNAWTVYFYVGCVDIFNKNDNHVGHVRFCRYITE